MLRLKGISRKYLRMAAMYRRFANRDRHYDWSLQSLIECYNHETHGQPIKKSNGYAFGKWCKDLSVVQWIEDIRKGDACKAEFYTPKDKWWTEKALANLVVPCAWFPYSNETDAYGNKMNNHVRNQMEK